MEGAMAKVLGKFRIMAKILGKLGVGDRARMRVVCKFWRGILTRNDVPVAPDQWMVVCHDSYSKPELSISEISFKSFECDGGKIYRFRIPVEKFNEGFWLLWQWRQFLWSPRLWHQFVLSEMRQICANPRLWHKFALREGLWRRRWCCCGSSRGWLLMAGGRFLRTMEMYLWNPISGDTRKLPPISTLPFFSKLFKEGNYCWDDRISSFVKRVQVFSVGSVDCVVAILLADRTMGELAVCSPQDHRWSVVVKGQHEDMIFHKGRLVASIDCRGEERDRLEESVVWKEKTEMHLSGCSVVVELACFVYETAVNNTSGLQTVERARIEEHLVECSITGELLLVTATYYVYGNDQGPIKPFRNCQTVRFEVRRVAGRDRLERMSCIGEQNIFVRRG